MRSILLPLVSTLALLGACSSTHRDARAPAPSATMQASWKVDRPEDPAPGTPAGEVVRELRNYYHDFSARDWEAFADHFWPNATLATLWTPPGAESLELQASTVPEFVAKAPEGPGSATIFEEWMTSAEIHVDGDLAQVWALYGARFGEPDDLVEWSGTDAFTLLQHEGRWRIVSLAWASDR